MKKGFHLSVLGAIVLGVLALGALIGVGFLVWHTAPRTECPVRTDQGTCDAYVQLYGTASVCRIEELSDKPTEEEEEPRVTGLRLNGTLLPSHYTVELWPRLYGDFGFTGNVTILMTCMMQTDVVVLQVDNLTVDEDSILLKNTVTGQTVPHSRVEEDVPRQFYKIYVDTSLNPNRNYSLSMSFNGTLIHPDWRGFYRSSYEENNVTYWLASTQFQRTHSRRAFPCFDEPAFKATFDVTLVRMRNFSSISNMPRAREEPWGTDWVADIYQRTVVMPTYLVAFVISQFEYVTSVGPKGLPIRIWSRPSFKAYAAYANDYTGPFINAFEEWTGIPYTLPKLDQIAIPDFRSGAMENWGLVTYRESALLYNPQYSENSDKRWVASVVAHELAHQWFGNLVTCHWWDDTFLNEGFATYFGDMVAMEDAMPEYEMDEYFIRRLFYIMDKDGHAKSQPVFVADLEHHDDLMKAFDIITYYKGASILRMIKYFLTERTFRAGIQVYLKKHEYQTVVHEDLYKELQNQAQIDGTVTWDESRTNLSGILDTWIEQQNYPVINVSDPENGKVTFQQSHFLYDREEEIATPTTIGPDFIWDVPLTYALKSELANNNLPTGLRIKWIHRDGQINLPIGVGTDEWFIVNLYEQGYYRVKYGPRTWNALLRQLMTDHAMIPVENRAGLLNDAFSLAQAQEFPEVEALRATQYLIHETEYLPFTTYTGPTANYLDMFYGKPIYDKLETYLRNLVIPAYHRVGWTVRDVGTEHLDRYTRIRVLGQACYRDYKPCVDKSKALLEQFITNPDNNPIPTDLRQSVYCTAVARGGNREWDFILEQYERKFRDTFIAYYKNVLEYALACATKPHIIRKALDYALSKNSTGLFMSIMGNRNTKDTAWNFINERWNDFMDGNTTRIPQADALKMATNQWHSDVDLRKLDTFMASHPEPKLTKTFDEIKKRIMKNMDWLEENTKPIEEFLVQANAGNSTTSSSSNTQGQGRRKRSITTHAGYLTAEFAEIQLRSEL